jgi:hypothetical protein
MFEFDIFYFFCWRFFSLRVFVFPWSISEFAGIIFFKSGFKVVGEFFVGDTVLNTVTSQDNKFTLRDVHRSDLRGGDD